MDRKLPKSSKGVDRKYEKEKPDWLGKEKEEDSK